jgi:hypothetical protein
MTRKIQILTLALGLALFGAVTSASAQSTLVTNSATDRGYYGSTGSFSCGSTANFLAGITDTYRDWFVFDLSSVSPGTIVSAQLMLLNPGTSYSITQLSGHYYPLYNGASGSGIYQAWDVSTSVNGLENGTTLAATFADLGSGVAYGSQAFFTADNGTFFTINLDSDFLTAAQTALGSGQIAVGGSIASSSGNLFGFSGGINPADTTLVLDIIPVPEPTTLALAGLGGLSLFLFRRRETLPLPQSGTELSKN